jgi:hypothetical protein
VGLGLHRLRAGGLLLAGSLRPLRLVEVALQELLGQGVERAAVGHADGLQRLQVGVVPGAQGRAREMTLGAD